MAEAWEDFGGDETPAWESFGSQASAPDFETFGDVPLPKKKPMTSWDRRLKEAQGQRPGLDEENEFGEAVYSPEGTYIPTPSNILRGGADLAARGFEYAAAAGNTFLDEVDEVYLNNGVADLPKLFGIDQQILPGSAIGALGEAFPLGGIEAGVLPRNMQMGKGDFLEPEARAKLDALYETGTADEILSYAGSVGAVIDDADLREWVDYRNQANPVVKPTYTPVDLEAEANAFTPSREPTVEDLFGPEKTIAEDTPAFLERPINNTRTRSPDAEPEGPFLARPEDLWPTEASRAADLAKMESDLLAEAQAFKGSTDVNPWEDFGPATKVEAEAPPVVDHTPIQEKITETIDGWANAPEFEVVSSVADIADEATRKAVAGNPNAKGFIGEDGKVRIIADNVTPDEVPAIVFHEALGHHGMTELFGQELDTKLTSIYDNAPWFKNQVDKWITANPSAYVDSPNRVARAADEIFAKMSEDGQLAHGKMKALYDQVVNTVKDFARKAGLKMEYSLREVESILSMAHNATIKGVTPVDNGFATGPRFMSGDKKSLTAEKMSTVGDIDDALDFIGREASRTKEGPQSLSETRRLAEEYGFNMSSRYLRGQSLSEKKLAARIEGGKQALTQQVQDLLSLRQKLETQGMSPSILMDIQEKIGTAAAVYGRFDNDTAELGRSLRLLREVTESRKLGKEMARFMEEGGLAGHLGDPDALIRFLDRLDEANKKGPAEAAKVLKEVKTNKLADTFGDIMNLPRSLMSTADLSAPLRQGISLIGTPQFWKGLPHMMKQFGSQKYADFIRDEIMSRPTYPLMEKAGIDITGGANLAAREEAFINRWVSKVPIAKHSERAYTGFLNKLRADTFDSLVKNYEKAGIDISKDKKILKDIGGYVNNATGRGNLGKWSQAAPHLNSIFFSPRLIASRLNLLNPVYYTKLDPIVRKEAIKNLSSMTAIAGTVIGLAKLNGADVETDPRSSDFAKIKTGNTRYDVLGGFGQYITLGSRIATNEKKKLNGDIVTLGEGFKEDDFTDILKNFGRNKLAPVPGFVVSSRVGTTPTGEEFVAKDEALKLFIPMFARDVYEAAQEEGAKGAASVAPALFGVGVQTFEGPRKRTLDEQGRDINNPEITPVSQELDRLNEVKKGALGYVGKKIKVDGLPKELTPEEHDDYQYVAGELLRQEMDPIINLPEWAELTEEEQLAVLKSVRTRTRKEARDALFKGEENDGV